MEENVKLKIELSEYGGEITRHQAEMETLNDVSLLLELMGFYIKLGFSHLAVKFSNDDCEIAYDPTNNMIQVSKKNSDYIFHVNAPSWGD